MRRHRPHIASVWCYESELPVQMSDSWPRAPGSSGLSYRSTKHIRHFSSKYHSGGFYHFNLWYVIKSIVVSCLNSIGSHNINKHPSPCNLLFFLMLCAVNRLITVSISKVTGRIFIQRKGKHIVRRISEDKWSWALFPVLCLTSRLQQSAARGACLQAR